MAASFQLTALEPYIAVVNQPACSNVFHVTASGKRTRLVQDSRLYCAAFAEGFMQADSNGRGTIRRFTCEAGDATTMDWKPER